MSDLKTAEIIPFPSPAGTRCAIITVSPPEHERLVRALATLDDALNAQREAMAAWKGSLNDLRLVTGRLGTSLYRYNESLEQLDSRVGALRANATKLETWAESASAQMS
jgi:chromosome segregation ATPase